jgi:hypothetical protein
MRYLERLQNQGDDKAGQFLASIMRFQFIISNCPKMDSTKILFWRFRGLIGSGNLSTTFPGYTIRYIKIFG